MSLLLDALKKSGAAQQGANGQSTPGSLSEMTLEELPGKPASAAPAVTQQIGSSQHSNWLRTPALAGYE